MGAFSEFLIPLEDISCKRDNTVNLTWWNETNNFGLKYHEEGWLIILLETMSIPTPVLQQIYSTVFSTQQQALDFLSEHVPNINVKLELGQERNRYPILSPKHYPNYTFTSIALRRKKKHKGRWGFTDQIGCVTPEKGFFEKTFTTRKKMLESYYALLEHRLPEFYYILGEEKYQKAYQNLFTNNNALDLEEMWLMFVLPDLSIQSIFT